MLIPLLVASIVAAQSGQAVDAIAETAVTVDGAAVLVRGSERDVATLAQVARVLPGALRAASRFGPVPATIVLTVHATHAELEAATGRTGNAWMRAWARIGAVDLQSPRSWTRGRASDAALAQILAHEITHCVLFQATGRDGRAREIPLWFTEGMASVAAGEHHDAADAEAIARPARLLRTDPDRVYGTADRAVRELLRLAGDGAVRRIVAALGEGHTFRAAFRDATGMPVAEFEADLWGRLSALAAVPLATAPQP